MSLEISLKHQLKEIKNRKNTLISESIYIQKRIKVLFENTDFNNQNDIIILRSELIKEMKTLRKNGLLTENQNIDMSGVLGGLGYLGKNIGKSLWDSFFKRVYRNIAEELGFDSNSFMFNVIVDTIQFTEWNDILKIIGGDCDLLTRKLSTGIISGLRGKIQDKMGIGGTGNQIIGNTLTHMLVDDPNSDIAKFIQKNISPIVCKKLEEWTGKVVKKGEEVKKEVEGQKKSQPSDENKPSFLDSARQAIGL